MSEYMSVVAQVTRGLGADCLAETETCFIFRPDYNSSILWPKSAPYARDSLITQLFYEGGNIVDPVTYSSFYQMAPYLTTVKPTFFRNPVGIAFTVIMIILLGVCLL